MNYQPHQQMSVMNDFRVNSAKASCNIADMCLINSHQKSESETMFAARTFAQADDVFVQSLQSNINPRKAGDPCGI